MPTLRLPHPLAEADSLAVFTPDPGFAFLLMSLLSEEIMLVGVATLFHMASGFAQAKI